jgi:hypothetical protein
MRDNLSIHRFKDSRPIYAAPRLPGVHHESERGKLGGVGTILLRDDEL